MAAQESEISNFMLRLSGTGTTVGMAEKDIVAMSAAMAGVGINAESGGSAMSKVMSKINTAVMSGGKELKGFADVAGISGKDFAETWKKDPYEAITLFEKGVKKAVDQGENHKQLLGELGIKELRETDTVLRLANGNKQLADAREHANKGWKEGTALSDEATERYKTLGSQIQLFKNELFALGRSIGSALAPALVALMKALTPIMRALSKAPDSVKLLIVALISIPVIIAPVAFALSGFVAVLGAAATAMEGFAAAGVAGGLGTKVFGKAVTAIKNPVGATKVAVGGLGQGFLAMINPLNWLKGGFGAFTKVLKLAFTGVRALTGPIGLLITGLTLLATWLIKSYKEVDWFRNGVNGAVEIVKVFAKGIGGGLITGIKNLGKWMGELGNKAKEFGKDWHESWKDTEVGKARIKEWNALKDTTKKVFDGMAEGSKKATDTSNALGKGVSKGTRQALQKYVGFSEGSIRAIEKIKINGGKLNKETQKELSDSIKKGGAEAVNAVKERNKKIESNLRKALENSTSISEEEKQNIIKKTQEASDKKVEKLEKLNKEISELEKKQYTDGKLTAEESKLLKSKLEERNKMTVKYVAKGAEEQQAILSRMDANTSGLSNQEISKALKASAKAEKKAIKEAAKIRDEGIKEADRALSDGSINKNEHRSIVLDLESDYNHAVDTANKKTKEVQKSVEKGNKGIWKEMNKQGETYTGAQKMWKDFSSAFMKYWGSGDSIKNTLTGWWNGYVETFTSLGNKGVDWIGKGFSSLGSKIGSWWNQGMSKSQVSWGILTQKLSSSWGSVSEWFVQKGQTMGSNIKSGWNKFLSTTGDWWSTLTGVLGLAWASTKQWFVNIGLKMGGYIKEGWGMFTSTVGNWWSSFVGMLSNGWKSTKQWFVNIGLKMGEAISISWNQSKELTFTVWTSIWNFIKDTWDWIWNKTSTATTWIWNRIKLVWDWVRNKTISAYTSVKNFLFNTWNEIWSKTKSATTWIWNKIKISWDWVRNKTITAYTIVRDFIVKVWTKIWSKTSSTTSLIWSKVKTSWDWVRNKTVGVYSFVRDYISGVWNKIWSKTKNTTTYIWNKIRIAWDWIRNKTVSIYTTIKNFLIKTWNIIWNKIKNTTTWIWNKVKTSWDAVKNKTVNIYTYIKNFLVRIWNAIWNKIKNTTTWIWNKVRSSWDAIRNKTTSIFSSVWNTIKNIWNRIWNFLRNTVQKIRNKIVNTWTDIKDNMRTMTNNIRNHTVGRFESMYNGAKKWVDKIGGYIDDAKGWMADKASSMGKAVANKAIDGLNLMIGGINKISKGITGSKLIDPINPVGGATVGKKLSTGTRKGRTRTNSKGQLKDPTLATVNDKGRGNGKGRNGHQELIIRQGKRIEVPQGRDVVTALEKGDAVVSGAETQSWQEQGIIPQFAKGTKGSKKKGLLDEALGAAGGALGGFGANLTNTAHQTKDKTENAVNGISQALEEGIKEGASALGHGMGNVMEWVEKPKQLVETMMKKMGVDFSGVAGGTGTLVKGAYSKLMPKLIEKVKDMFSEVEGGDGDASWLIGGKYPQLQPFGKYVGMTMNGTDNHYGLDFGMPTGTKIRALTSGKISQSGWTPYGGGNQITLDEPGGKWFQWYMHMSKLIAKKGQTVNAGDVIGLSGNTGSSSTPHLHIQRMKGRVGNDTAVDPTNWLKSLKGGGSKNKKASAWRDDIRRAAAQMSTKVSNSDINNIISLINAESGGNAGVTQSASLLDINTLMGNPAQGLLQYIPQTFKRYAVKGHTNIKSGFDQLLAFFNNKNWRTQFNPNGGWSPSGPRRFARGGIIEKDQLIRAGEGNRKEMVIPLTRKTRAMQLIDQAKSMMGVGPDGSVSIGDGGNLNDEKLDKLILAIGNLTKVVEDKRLVVDGEAISDYTNNNLGKKMNKYGYMSGQPNG